MTLGGGVQAVDRLAGHVQRGVESERNVGGAQIVVDRLRHADHVDAVGLQPARDAQRVLAADRDHALKVVALKCLPDALDAVLAPVRIGS